MSITDKRLEQLLTQAQFNVATKESFHSTSAWADLAEALKELIELRGYPVGTLLQRKSERWIAMTPDGVTRVAHG